MTTPTDITPSDVLRAQNIRDGLLALKRQVPADIAELAALDPWKQTRAEDRPPEDPTQLKVSGFSFSRETGVTNASVDGADPDGPHALHAAQAVNFWLGLVNHESGDRGRGNTEGGTYVVYDGGRYGNTAPMGRTKADSPFDVFEGTEEAAGDYRDLADDIESDQSEDRVKISVPAAVIPALTELLSAIAGAVTKRGS